MSWLNFFTLISDIRARQKAGRDIAIIRLTKLGWPQEKIAQVVGTTQARVAQIINNANFGEIYNLLSQGRDMNYIAEHYHLKKKKEYGVKATEKTASISSYTKNKYEEFFEKFFFGSQKQQGYHQDSSIECRLA